MYYYIYLSIQLGDIVVTGDKGAQALVLPEVCEQLCAGLKQVCAYDTSQP
jgi:RNA-binding protein YlmH